MLTANSVICFTALLLHDATSATTKLVLLQNLPISAALGEIGHSESEFPRASFRRSRHSTNSDMWSDVSKQGFSCGRDFYLVLLWFLVTTRVSLMSQIVKYLPAMWETWVRSLSQEDPLKEGMATHFSILAWRIPLTQEPGRLQLMGSQRVRHDWATKRSTAQVSQH